MDTVVGTPRAGHDARPSRVALWLCGGAVLCLVAAGGLLWWGTGDAVFASLVDAALALCF